MPSPSAAVADPKARRAEDRRRRVWPVTELAAAAVFLFTIATGYVFYREYPSDNDDPSAPAAAPFGTPGSEAAGVDFAECDVEPRTEPLTMLGNDGSPVSPVVPGSAEVVRMDQVPDGPAADARVEAAMVDAVRQLTACRYYDRVYDQTGRNGRYFALLSDDYGRRTVAGKSVYDLYYWRPSDGTPAVVERTVTLPDGRIGAVLRERERSMWGFGPESEFRFFLVFVENDDRWLVDEAYTIADDGTPAVPLRPSESRPTLELVLRDMPNPSVSPGTFEDLATSGLPFYAGELFDPPGFPAGTDVTLVLRNVGEVSQRVEITALGIEVDVAPMTTKEIVVNAPAGQYVVAAYIGGDASALGGLTRLIMFDPNTPYPPGRG